MEWWLLTFFFSAILSLFLPIVPEFSLLLVILLFSLLLIFINKFRLMAIATFAIVWILMAGSQQENTLQKNNITPELLHKKVHLIQGEVLNIVNKKNDSSRFNFLITHWQGQQVRDKFKLRLTWKMPEQELLQGQRWQLVVKLKPAHGLANIGAFNYQVWLRQQQIIATGYVKPDQKTTIPLKSKKRNILLQQQTSWRQYLYQRLSGFLAEKPLGGLILALGFGERGKLTPEHWQVLSATATQHLIAISGLHIGIVAFASLVCMRTIVRFFPLSVLLPKSWQLKLLLIDLTYLPVLASCLMAWYYAYLAGFSIPTLRALVMLLLFWSLQFMTIKLTLLRWFLFAIVIILLIWPLSLLSASFWLSISALVIIFSTFSRFSMIEVPSDKTREKLSLLAFEKLPKSAWLTKCNKLKLRVVRWFKTLLVLQLALTMAMLPIAASLNYQLPLAAFFANIVAVPLMSVTVIPLTLLAVIALPFSVWLSKVFVDLALFTLSFVWQWLNYLTSAKWAIVAVSYQQIQVLLLFFVLIALMLFFRLNRAKFIATLTLFFGVLATEFFSAEDSKVWQLSVLDIGHGLAVVVEKNNQVFLYDTGASYPSGFNMADAAILPYLKYQGYQSIDTVIISHNDNDHAGGLRHLRAKMTVREVIANDLELMPDQHCISGQRFTWQGLVVEILSPLQVYGDKNDDSCVVTISDGSHRVLLPGDISVKQERRLLSIAGMNKKLTSDVLIAPHHGSKSSSSRRFLAAVAPRYAVFSTGYLNRWQMPSQEILQRYHAFDITTLNSAELGMVTFKFSQTLPENDAKSELEGNIKVLSYRKDIRPYWYVN